MNIRTLNEAGLTPEVLLQYVHKEVSAMEELYVVSFDKDGTAQVWATGDPKGMALAGALLTDHALHSTLDDIDCGGAG